MSPEEFRSIIREEVRPIIREEFRTIVREEVRSTIRKEVATVRGELASAEHRIIARQHSALETFAELSKFSSRVH